jgi:hypothetical protein
MRQEPVMTDLPVAVSSTSSAGSVGPLAGLVVADFLRVLAGPYATMPLADLGAEVIEVEGPGGDDTRGWVPPVGGSRFLGVTEDCGRFLHDVLTSVDELPTTTQAGTPSPCRR